MLLRYHMHRYLQFTYWHWEDSERPVNLTISIRAHSPSIPPFPHPSRPCWTIMVASSHVWVHTLHWAMLFNYLRWSPRWKYIAHISEAKCLGQTQWEIKYTLCHLIWQLSFTQLLYRGRHMYSCGGCVQCGCSQCRCVYKSSHSYFIFEEKLY